jgi:hypothetical protein
MREYLQSKFFNCNTIEEVRKMIDEIRQIKFIEETELHIIVKSNAGNLYAINKKNFLVNHKS